MEEDQISGLMSMLGDVESIVEGLESGLTSLVETVSVGMQIPDLSPPEINC